MTNPPPEHMSEQTKPKMHWTIGERGLDVFWTAKITDCRYWITCDRFKKWQVEDDCGGVWGSYPTADAAKAEVEKLEADCAAYEKACAIKVFQH